jgi:hypothetical protein
MTYIGRNEKSNLYERAKEFYDRLKAQGCKYTDLNTTRLRAIGFMSEREHDPAREGLDNTIITFLLDPSKISITTNLISSDMKNPLFGYDLLCYFRKFSLFPAEYAYEKRKRSFPIIGKVVSSERIVSRGIYLSNPLSEEDSPLLLDPKIKFVASNGIVYPFYQKDLEELVELADETKCQD